MRRARHRLQPARIKKIHLGLHDADIRGQVKAWVGRAMLDDGVPQLRPDHPGGRGPIRFRLEKLEPARYGILMIFQRHDRTLLGGRICAIPLFHTRQHPAALDITKPENFCPLASAISKGVSFHAPPSSK